MIGEKVQDAFNEQINAELYSAYLYLSMAAQLEAMNLRGFANWMRQQAREEIAHAMKFFAHVNERGGRVTLTRIDAPPKEWPSPLAIFQDAYRHEQKVTGLIDKLVTLAAAEGDNAGGVFLQWFVSEQVEEEAAADGIVRKLKMISEAPGGLFMMDRELGERNFTPPSGKGEE